MARCADVVGYQFHMRATLPAEYKEAWNNAIITMLEEFRPTIEECIKRWGFYIDFDRYSNTGGKMIPYIGYMFERPPRMTEKLRKRYIAEISDHLNTHGITRLYAIDNYRWTRKAIYAKKNAQFDELSNIEEMMLAGKRELSVDELTYIRDYIYQMCNSPSDDLSDYLFSNEYISSYFQIDAISRNCNDTGDIDIGLRVSINRNLIGNRQDFYTKMMGFVERFCSVAIDARAYMSMDIPKRWVGRLVRNDDHWADLQLGTCPFKTVSWGMLFTKTQLELNGGLDSIKNTGIFAVMKEYANGSVWMQMTDDIGSYPIDKVRRLRAYLRNLAPCEEETLLYLYLPSLRTGVPKENIIIKKRAEHFYDIIVKW